MKPTDKFPEDKQYVYIDHIYMGKRIDQIPAMYRHHEKINGGKPIFLFDFYSGTGWATLDEVIEWRPRSITYKGESRAWTTIQDGTDGL